MASSYYFVTWSLIASSYSLEVAEFCWRENGMGLLLLEGKTSGWCYRYLFKEFTAALSECRLTSLLLSLFHVPCYGSVWGRCLVILVFIVVLSATLTIRFFYCSSSSISPDAMGAWQIPLSSPFLFAVSFSVLFSVLFSISSSVILGNRSAGRERFQQIPPFSRPRPWGLTVVWSGFPKRHLTVTSCHASRLMIRLALLVTYRL